MTHDDEARAFAERVGVHEATTYAFTTMPRLLATLDAYREIARAVRPAHRALFQPLNVGDCHFCFGHGRHQDHCPVTRARALLGEEAP